MTLVVDASVVASALIRLDSRCRALWCLGVQSWAVLKKRGSAHRVERSRHQISLSGVTAELTQQLEDFFVLDAFGHRAEPEVLGQLAAIEKMIGAPIITGQTPNSEREEIFAGIGRCGLTRECHSSIT